MIVVSNSFLPLSSSGYPSNYPNGLICSWTVQGGQGGRILVEFVDFHLETDFDHLYIGTQENPRQLTYTGLNPTQAYVVSPVNVALYFEFETDGSANEKGFLLYLNTTDQEDFIFCDNGLEVLPDESFICDKEVQCQDGSDEQPFCECGDLEITLKPGSSIVFTSLNYPSNYTHLTNCPWEIRPGPDSILYVKFEDFHLAREDYLYVATTPNEKQPIRYTKDQTPPDLCRDSSLFLTFVTDSSETSAGFSATLTAVDRSNFDGCETCANGVEVLPSDATCDGIINCFDVSDELPCPPCEPISLDVCRNRLPYDQTYYRDFPPSAADASQIYSLYDAMISNCPDSAYDFLCATLFRTCPHEGDTTTLCQGFCLDALNSCPPLVDLGVTCEHLPVSDEGATFCTEDDLDLKICGTRPAYNPSSRIVGGEEKVEGSWPWIGSIQDFEGHHCGCTLVSETWAVTASHCMYYRGRRFLTPEELTVRFGVIKQSERLSYEVEVAVAAIYVHPRYEFSNDTHFNDVTLLRLAEPVEFSDYVRPACLASDSDEETAYSSCMAGGWGRTIQGGDYPVDHQRQVSVPLISSTRCRSSEFKYGPNVITDAMICAGEEGRDTCQGDSGGPLVCQDMNGLWHLVGATSFGFGCAQDGFPGVYARVSYFLDYIRDIMSGKFGIDGSGLCAPDQFQCDSGQCISSSWDQCNFIDECVDGSDEAVCDYCGLDKDITICDSDNTAIVDLISKNYPSPYPWSSTVEITCQWTVTSASGSRVYVHFVDIDLHYSDTLHFGISVDQWNDILVTGSDLLVDFVSPFGTDTLVITFVVRPEGEPGRGFHLELSCTNEEFTVCQETGYQVIEQSMLCDGNLDCLDESDEGPICSIVTCPPDQLLCDDVHGGSCILNDWVCDGNSDCLDGTDEEDCPTTQATCPPGQFLCASHVLCILDAWICDGNLDCDDGSDEVGCPTSQTCNSTEFQCASGTQCVAVGVTCDGFDDCNDGSDEADCPVQTCPPGETPCDEGEVCLPDDWFCDEFVDCVDGSDESVERCSCAATEYMCSSGDQCIPESNVCDGFDDCNDGSEEIFCSASCPPGTVMCDADSCILPEWICDDKPDCIDGTDEAGCPTTEALPPA